MKLQIVRTKEWLYKYAIYLAIIFPFMYPTYFSRVETYKILEYITTYSSIALMAYIIVKNRFKMVSLHPFVVLLVEYSILIFSTFINNGLFVTTVNTSIKKILLFIIVGKALTNERDSNCMMYAVRDLTVLLFTLNMVSEILYPTGIPSITINSEFPYFFLGNVNTIIREVFAGLCCSVLIGIKTGRKITASAIYIIVGLLYQFVFVYHGATTLFALIIIISWIVFSDHFIRHVKAIYIATIIIVAYIEISIVLLASNYTLSNIIANLFGKDITFSGRTFIWLNTFRQIKRKPIFGYGVQKASLLEAIIGNKYSAHNYFLDLLYQRGMVGLFVFLILLGIPIYYLGRIQNISKTSYYLIGFCCAIFSMFLFESFYSSEAVILPIIFCMLQLLHKEWKYKKAI